MLRYEPFPFSATEFEDRGRSTAVNKIDLWMTLSDEIGIEILEWSIAAYGAVHSVCWPVLAWRNLYILYEFVP